MADGPRILAHKAPGLPCPECATPIVVDPMTLLAAAPIVCAGCGLELQIDKAKSAETLAVLKEYMDDFAAVQDMLADEVGPTAGGGRAPRRRASSRPARGRRRGGDA